MTSETTTDHRTETTGRSGLTTRAPRRDGAPREIGPLLGWYAVIGGPTAWAVHLALAWSVLEISCLGVPTGPIPNRGGEPGPVATTLVWAGTGVPWLVALGALVASFVIRRRRKALLDDPATDALASGRTGLFVVLGISLALMSLAAISGGALAFWLLEPCG